METKRNPVVCREMQNTNLAFQRLLVFFDINKETLEQTEIEEIREKLRHILLLSSIDRFLNATIVFAEECESHWNSNESTTREPAEILEEITRSLKQVRAYNTIADRPRLTNIITRIKRKTDVFLAKFFPPPKKERPLTARQRKNRRRNKGKNRDQSVKPF